MFLKMTRTFSPLRYPGGKARLSELLAGIIEHSGLRDCHYIEPYAGGCGLALSLLFNDKVSRITINDIDPSIWSFWKAVLDHTEELVELIRSTELSVDQWLVQREIQREGDMSDPVRLGFATFYLNRTNRSGIISGASVIGGMSQSGKYKMDCRFNREALIRRIRRISGARERIALRRDDAVDLMRVFECSGDGDTLFCIDPPYFGKGSRLYTSFYNEEDHAAVAAAVRKLRYPWVVTYDNVSEIQKLYRGSSQFTFNINYSVQSKRVGTELLVTSKGINVPEGLSKIQPERLIA